LVAQGEAAIVGHLDTREVRRAFGVGGAGVETHGVFADKDTQGAWHPAALKRPGMEAGLLAADLLERHAEKDHGAERGLVLTEVAIGAVLLAELGTESRVPVVGLETVS
jgi:hypothetical protein